MAIFYGPEEAQRALGIDDRWARRVGMLIMAMTVAYGFQDTGFRPVSYLISVGISLINVIIYWEGNRQIVIRCNLRFPDYSQIWQRLRQQFLLVTLYSVAVSLLIHLTLNQWVQSIQGGDIFPFRYNLFLGLGLTYVALAFYEAINFFQRWKSSVIEQERLQVAQARSELENLKNQVNPHFLFNSLNTLAALIPRDPDQATEFVQRLSKVYRYVLEVPATRPITLVEELGFLDDYLALLRTRHGAALQVEMKGLEAYSESLMVPLALQILVENAVKHNVVSKKYPLQLRIEADEAGLRIANSRKPKAGTVPSTGLGLANLRARYLLLGKTAITVSSDPGLFEVLLPWIAQRDESLAEK